MFLSSIHTSPHKSFHRRVYLAEYLLRLFASSRAGNVLMMLDLFLQSISINLRVAEMRDMCCVGCWGVALFKSISKMAFTACAFLRVRPSMEHMSYSCQHNKCYE